MYKFFFTILISLFLAADSIEQASWLFTDDVDLIVDNLNEVKEVDTFIKKSGSTNPVTDKFYNIAISNSSISSTNSNAGTELKQSGRYYLANSISRVPVTGKPVIKISGSDIVLDMNGFVIDGSLATSSHADMIGIEIAASSRNVTIINGSLNTIKGMGIKVGAGTDTITVKDVKITSCADSGVECAGTSGSKIKNLYLNNVQVSSGNGSQRDSSRDAYGFRAEYVVSGSVENCSFQNMVPSVNGKDGIGIYLNACENLQCSNCSMNNNKASSSTASPGWGDSNSGKITDTNVYNWYSIYVDSSSNTYVTGQNTPGAKGVTVKYDANGDITTNWGDSDSGKITDTSVTEWKAIYVDGSGNTYVAGYNTSSRGVVVKYDANGDITTNWGDSDSGKITDTAVSSWESIYVDGSGNTYVAGYNTSNRGVVVKYDANGDITTNWGDSDSGKITDTAVSIWYKVSVDSTGNTYVSGQSTGGSGVIVKYDANGDITTNWGNSDSGKITDLNIKWIYAMFIDSSGQTYVAGQDSADDKAIIAKYDANGDITTNWGDSNSGRITNTAVAWWEGVFVNSIGETFVTGLKIGNTGISAKYDSSGVIASGWGSSGSISDSSSRVWNDIYLDSSGNSYVAGRSTPGDKGLVAKYNIYGELDAAPSSIYGAGKGVYLTGSTQGCKFSGCSASNTSGNSAGSAYGLYLDSAKDCVFENCVSVSNNGANATGVSAGGFRLEAASTNNQFVNCVSQGHTVSGTTSSVYGWQVSSNNNRFTNCIGSGIGSSSGGAAYGFYFSSTNNNNLLNCKASGNQSSGATNCYGFYSTAGRSNMFNKCEGSSNTAATGKCAGIALDAGETLSTISGGNYSGNQVTGAGSCYGIVLDPANASGVNRCSITNNTVSMNYATTNGATLAGLRDFTTDCNSLIAGNVLSLNGNARLNIGSAPNYNIDSSDLTIDGSGNGGLNLYLTYDDGQNVADMVNETDVSNLQALSTSLMGWTNMLVVPQQQ